MTAPRPILRVAATLAALGLVGALAAVPAAADSCSAATAVRAEASGGVALTHGAEFTCADAAGAGAWSITVEVANGSDAAVTITDATLAGITPSVQAQAATAADATVEASGLPLSIAAGQTGSFQLSGDYTLAQVGAVALANLHVRATGVSAGAGSHPVALAINVHILGPGAELSDDGSASVGVNAHADGEARASHASVPAAALLDAFFRGELRWNALDVTAAAAAAGAGSADASAEGAGSLGAGAAVTGDSSVTARSERAPSGSDGQAQAEARAGAQVHVEIGGSSSVSIPVLGD